MRPGRLLLLAVSIAALMAGGLGLWLVGQGSTSSAETARAEAAGPDARERPEDPQELRDLETDSLQEASERVDAALPSFGPSEDARWVDVRVVLPRGTPPDEELAVVARVVPVDGEGEHTRFEARPAPDGTLRVPFPREARSATLDLRAHYVYLEERHELWLPTDGPVTLEPRLGGRLRARFELPAALPEGFELERMGSAQVALTGWSLQGGSHSVATELGPSLEVDVGGLRPELTYVLSADPEEFAEIRTTLTVTPAEIEERSFQLHVGARVLGRVVDEGGRGLPGAAVTLASSGARAGLLAVVSMPVTEIVETQADGSFSFSAVPPGEVTLEASLEGRLPSEPLELELADLQLVEGLELVTPAGARVSGRVGFPDGRPAAGAELRLEEPVARTGGRRTVVFEQRHTAQTDAEGRFSVGGLGPGPYELRVQTAVVSDEAVGEHVRLHRAEVWRARAEDVRPGAELALVLEPPMAVTGRVQDDTGAAITRFRVRATEADEGGPPWRVVATTEEDETESADGSFRLDTLGRGTWKLAVEADGHGPGEERTLTLPGESGPFTFVLPRAGSVAGRVLDPAGRPAGGADVAFSDTGALARVSGRRETTQADEHGRFCFETVVPGVVELVARREGSAPSEALTVEVQPAVPIQELELHLRIGGTLTGEVFRPDGGPDGGRQVMLQRPLDAQDAATASTDGAGRFAVEHLAPGRYQVVAMPDAELLEGAERDPGRLFEQLRMETVEIVDGQSAHVVLGAPPTAPVELSGRVLEAGRPVPDVTLMALAEGAAMLSKLKSARTDGDGAFGMRLPAPGDWILLVGESFQGDALEFALTVPEVERHHVELELPGGRISGRVLGPDGAPAASVQVSLSTRQAVSIFNTSGGREAQSDQDGRFEFTRLRSGAYELRAGLDAAAGFFGGAAPGYGVALLSGMTLDEGGALDGLELRLTEPGTIRGVVLASSGAPAPDAAVWVRDAAGRVLNPRSWSSTDGAGRFEFQGAGRGRYTVLARSAQQASAEIEVEVSEGSASEVELELRGGTILLVTVEDGEGALLRAALRVFDDAGREVSGLSSMLEFERTMMEGFSTREARVGPLAPGRYRVEATAEDGARAAKPVTLSGQAERRLRLRLRD